MRPTHKIDDATCGSLVKPGSQRSGRTKLNCTTRPSYATATVAKRVHWSRASASRLDWLCETGARRVLCIKNATDICTCISTSVFGSVQFVRWERASTGCVLYTDVDGVVVDVLEDAGVVVDLSLEEAWRRRRRAQRRVGRLQVETRRRAHCCRLPGLLSDALLDRGDSFTLPTDTTHKPLNNRFT